jgi:thiamine-monophosphate kinase
MGARPLACILSLAVPSDLAVRPLEAALRGLTAEAAQRGAPLVGGNVARASETSFHLTALGAVRRGRALRRSGARPGDRLLVTGELGRSALARARAEARGRPGRYVPPDRLRVGRALASLGGRVCCIDLSDGLASDVRHLLGPQLGVEIDAAALPRAGGFDASCRRLGLDPISTLAGGGEDYELLFCLPARRADPVRLARRLGVRVTTIGRFVAEPGVRGLAAGQGGWRHF